MKELIMEEVPALSPWIAPVSRKTFHARNDCRVLMRAGNTRPLEPCAVCCPNNLLTLERRRRTNQHMFVT